LRFSHLNIFHPDGFHSDGGIGEQFSKFESLGDELSPKELQLSEIGLLKEVESPCLFGREVKL
jgi:hypothetical protein